MQAAQYAEKIKKLVAQNEISTAISELSQLAKNSKWLHGAITQSARFEDINRQILLGLVSYQDANLERNRVIEAILSITQEIENNSTREFNIAINEFENRTPRERLSDVAEIIYSAANNILLSNQDILAPIFNQGSNKFEIAQRMTEVFHQQKSRGSFARWVAFLEEIEKNTKNQESVRFEASSLVKILAEFHSILYSYIPNFTPDKLRNGDVRMIDSKFIMSQLHQFEDEEAKEIVQSYLERLRSIIQKIGQIAEKINLITEDERVVSIKSSTLELYSSASEIFKPFKALNSQIDTLIKSNKINKEQFNKYLNTTSLIRSEILEINELKRNFWVDNYNKTVRDCKNFIEDSYQNMTIERLRYTLEKLQSYKSKLGWIIWRDKTAMILFGLIFIFVGLFKNCSH